MQTVENHLLTLILSDDSRSADAKTTSLRSFLGHRLHFPTQMSDLSFLAPRPVKVVGQFFQIEGVFIEDNIDSANHRVLHLKCQASVYGILLFFCFLLLLLSLITLEGIYHKLEIGLATFRFVETGLYTFQTGISNLEMISEHAPAVKIDS